MVTIKDCNAHIQEDMEAWEGMGWEVQITEMEVGC